jgi:hypothetical protein
MAAYQFCVFGCFVFALLVGRLDGDPPSINMS